MAFTSADLPLVPAVAPPSVQSDSDATSPSLMSDSSPPPPPPPTKPLIASVPTVLFLLKTVLITRAQTGDDWAQTAAVSHSAVDLHHVVVNAPVPTAEATLRSMADPAEAPHAALYEAALFPESTPFDLPFSTIANVHALMGRLAKVKEFSPSVLITAFIYLDRLVGARPGLFTKTSNIYLLFGVAVMLGVKYLEDGYYGGDFFAELVGVSAKRLAALETDFLTAMRHRLFVRPEQFARAQAALIAEALDSPNCEPVLAELQAGNFAGLDAGMALARAWAAARPVARRRGPPAWWLEAAGAHPTVPNEAAAAAPATRARVRLLATAQLRFDLDVPRGADPSAAQLSARTSRLSARGSARVSALLQLAHGASAPTAVPALELVTFEPHTAFGASALSTGIWGAPSAPAKSSRPAWMSWYGKGDAANPTVLPVPLPQPLPARFTDAAATSRPASSRLPARTQPPAADTAAWPAPFGSAMAVDPAPPAWVAPARPRPQSQPAQLGAARPLSSLGSLGSACTAAAMSDVEPADAQRPAAADRPPYSLGPSMWSSDSAGSSGGSSAWGSSASQPAPSQPQPPALQPVPETAETAAEPWGGAEWGSQCTVAAAPGDVWGRGWSTEMREVSTSGASRSDVWAGM